MKPKRVLHIIKSMDFGGAETFIMNVYRNMPLEEIQFDFALSKLDGTFVNEIKKSGGDIFPLPNPTRKPFRYFFQLLILLKSKGPYMAVHSHLYLFSGAILAISRALRVPVRIAHSHTGIIPSTKITKKIYNFIMRGLVISNSTHILGCSEIALESLYGTKLFKKDIRTKLIKNAMDHRIISHKLIDKSIAKKNMLIPNGQLVIGHIGRFTRSKNHLFLLEILDRMLHLNKEVCLVLVGDGPLRETVKSEVNRRKLNNRVHFLGFRTDIPFLLSCMDVFIFPSLFEGLGISLIEAQLAGVPCVVSENIPADADLRTGLFTSVQLQDTLDTWIDHIEESSMKTIPTMKYRIDQFRQSGYEIADVITQLKEIYGLESGN